MALSTSDRALVTGVLLGVAIGAVIGACTVWFTARGTRACVLDDAQLRRLQPAPTPIAAAAPPPVPAPVAPVAPVAVVAAPEPSWRVDEAKVWRWNDGKPGFALRVDLMMTRLGPSTNADPLRVKTGCTLDGTVIVETVGIGPPPGDVLAGERATGAFFDPFYWKRLEQEPTRCTFEFTADGADAGRFCIDAPAAGASVIATPCEPEVEAPMPAPPPTE